MIVGVVVRGPRRVLPIGKLEEMVNIGTLFAFVLVSIGVIVLRRTRPDLERGFRVPFVPVVPILSVLACLWLMLNLSVETWLRFIVWMVVGRRRLLPLRPLALDGGAARTLRLTSFTNFSDCLDLRQNSR